MEVVYAGTSHLIRINGAKSAVTGAYLNSATVTANVVTITGAALPTAVAPTISYSGDGAGGYTGTLTSTHVSNLSVGQTYRLDLTFDSGPTAYRTDFIPFEVRRLEGQSG